MTLWLGVSLGAFVLVTYAVAWRFRTRIQSAEDFIVSGRRLPLSLSFATLLATWFGAGTLLTAADEVRAEGLSKIALEPLGAGLCLVLAGIFFAARLWRMKLLTFGDFFARRFGARAEVAAAVAMIPTYFGWIAVQFLAVAGILELFFGLPMWLGVPLVAVVAAGYTAIGGMWSVAITDALQLAVVAVGLIAVAVGAWTALGELDRLSAELPAPMLEVIPRDDAAAALRWFSVLAISALGNLAGQDLLQRVFSAKSERVARQACVLSGIAYVGLGAVPVFLGLAARVLLPDQEQSIVPALAAAVLSPAAVVVFSVALTAAVLSTIDGALLAPASVFARNLAPKILGREVDLIAWTRGGVIVTALVAVVVAFAGESAYGLLEDAYELGFVSLFVPLAVATFRAPRREAPALIAIALGATSWLAHYSMGWDSFLGPAGPGWLPPALPTVALALAAYVVADRRSPAGPEPPGRPQSSPAAEGHVSAGASRRTGRRGRS